MTCYTPLSQHYASPIVPAADPPLPRCPGGGARGRARGGGGGGGGGGAGAPAGAPHPGRGGSADPGAAGVQRGPLGPQQDKLAAARPKGERGRKASAPSRAVVPGTAGAVAEAVAAGVVAEPGVAGVATAADRKSFV